MNIKLEFAEAIMDASKEELSTTEALILLAYAHRCDFETGQGVRSSHTTVARRAKVNRITVVRLTKGLVTKGWLVPVALKNGVPTEYNLAIPDAVSVTGRICNVPEHQEEGCSTEPQVPVAQDYRGVAEGYRGCSTGLHNKTIRPLEDIEEEPSALEAQTDTPPGGGVEEESKENLVTFSKIINEDGSLFNPENVLLVDDWGIVEDYSNSESEKILDPNLELFKHGKYWSGDPSKVDWAAAQALLDDAEFYPDETAHGRALYAAYRCEKKDESDLAVGW